MEVHDNNPGGKNQNTNRGPKLRKNERVGARVDTLQPGSLWSLETEKLPDTDGKEVMRPTTVFP